VKRRVWSLALPLVLTASQWLGGAALATPKGTAGAPQRTMLTRLRTAHEMVTVHGRNLDPTKTSDGSEIAALRKPDGTRVYFSSKDVEAEYNFDDKGRTRELVMVRAQDMNARTYRPVGIFKVSNGSTGEALWSVGDKTFDLRLHFDEPIGVATRLSVVLAPTQGTKPALIRRLEKWDADVVQATFDRKQVLEHTGGAAVRAWAEITRASGEVHRVQLPGPFELGD
jgi:hypothetical protein